MKWKWLIGAVATLALAGAGAGLAASRGGSGSSAAPAAAEPFLSSVAKRVGVAPEQLLAAMKAEAKARLDKAVADGRVPAAIAERIKARIDAATLERPLGLLGPKARGGGLQGGMRPRREAGKAAAEYLGLTRAEPREQLRQGKSLAQVAKDRGKSVEGLKAAILAEAKARLDRAVANGKLTQARADELYRRLEGRIDDVVERTPPARPGFGARFGRAGPPTLPFAPPLGA